MAEDTWMAVGVLTSFLVALGTFWVDYWLNGK